MKQLLLILAALLTIGCYAETSDVLTDASMGGSGNEDAMGDKYKQGWSSSGRLATRNNNVAVKLQALFPTIDTFTVQFGIGRNGTAGVVERPQAEVTWSVAGQQIVRRFDVLEGTSISGLAEGVTVRLYDQGGLTGTINASYLGTIAVARGQRAGTMRPSLNAMGWTPSVGPFVDGSIVSVPGGGGTAYTIIPAGVGAQEFIYGITPVVAGTPLNSSLVTVRVEDDGAGPYSSYADAHGRWLPIGYAGRRLFFQNNNVGNDALLSVVYGIDG